ncbi:MAG: efflux RND transporter periplasmic adaptor subunit [Syntrophomonas sp.]
MKAILKYKTKILLIGLVLIIYAAYRYTSGSAVEYLELVEQEYYPALELSGEVTPQQDATLSFPAEGQVLEIAIKEGDKVSPGQILIRLDDRQALLTVQLAHSDLQTAQINLEKGQIIDRAEAMAASVEADEESKQAAKKLERMRSLASAGAITQEALEDAEKAALVSQEKAALARAKAESYQPGGSSINLLMNDVTKKDLALQEAQLKLDKCYIKTPFAGTVLKIYAKLGELAQKDQEAVWVGTDSKPRVHLKPDQQYRETLTLGMQARVWLSGFPDKTWPGKITAIEPAANSQLGTLNVYVDLDENPPELNPGRLVEIQLTATRSSRAYIVGDRWLSSQNGTTGVWLYREGRAHFASVSVRSRTKQGAIISQGLHNGDKILLPDGLSEGLKVRLTEKAEK